MSRGCIAGSGSSHFDATAVVWVVDGRAELGYGPEATLAHDPFLEVFVSLGVGVIGSIVVRETHGEEEGC